MKDNKNIKKIMNLGLNNIINYLLRYPLANILSDYLINNHQIEINNNISNELLQLNLYELLNKSKNFNYLKTQ